MLIDHVLGENLLRMLHKKQKKCRLLGRKDQLFVIFVKTHGCGIIAEWTAFQSIGIVEYQILVAADQCFYFGTKYKRTERLGDIIIRTKGKSVQGIIVLVTSADDHNRGTDPLIAKPFDDLKSFHISQHNIHKDQVKCMIFKDGQSIHATVYCCCFQLIAVHYFFQQLTDCRIIVYDQYFVSH